MDGFRLMRKEMRAMDQQKEDKLFQIVRRRNVVSAVLIFIGVFVIQIAVYLIITFGMQLFFMLRGQPTGQMTVYTKQFIEIYSVVWSTICAIWCGILYNKSEWRYSLDYRKVFQRKHLMQIFLIGFCGCFVTLFLIGIWAAFFPQGISSYEKTMENLSSGTLLMLCYTLFAGPVAEEFIFRGVIFDRLFLAFPFWIANGLQALLFAVYHGNVVQGSYAFLFGLLLGEIHYVSKSIYNNIFCHILFNMTNYIAAMAVDALNQAEFTEVFYLLFFLSIAGLCYGIISLCREGKTVEGEKDE